jgi:hypothetical protein
MQMIILPGMDVAENMAILMDVKGVSYKGDLFDSGKAQVAKEQYHVSYDKKLRKSQRLIHYK